jgi:pSer/pThr/pTyr-binding forkhead associated (FHA) protein
MFSIFNKDVSVLRLSPNQTFKIGRANCDLNIPSKVVSRHHATIKMGSISKSQVVSGEMLKLEFFI